VKFQFESLSSQEATSPSAGKPTWRI